MCGGMIARANEPNHKHAARNRISFFILYPSVPLRPLTFPYVPIPSRILPVASWVLLVPPNLSYLLLYSLCLVSAAPLH